MAKTNDLTQGNICKKLVLFFIPIAMGTLLQQLYNAVDAIIVGKFVGTNALAAVGGSSAIMTQLIIGFFVALASGTSVVIAQQFGAGDKEQTSKAVGTAVASFLVIGIALTVIMFFCSRPILNLLNTPDETIEQAGIYCRIYFSGSTFLIMFNIGSGILRAVGNSRKPLFFLMISCLSNIALDLLFVLVFKMGVAGVALATVTAQAIAGICIITSLARTNEIYKLRKENFRIDARIFKKMMRIGIPTCIQASMYGISNIILTIAINGLGTVIVASWAMSGKIDGVYWAISEAFGIALMNFVAQNYGAKNTKRIKEGSRIGMLIFMAITITLSVTLLLLARPLLNFFSDDQAVRDTTWKVITYFVPTYFTWSLIEGLSGILRGVGDTLKPAVILAIGICGVRILWVMTMFRFYPTLFVISMSYPLSWFVTDIALGIYYLRNRKKLIVSPSA